MLTVDELKKALPVYLKTAASQELVDRVNGIGSDPEIARQIQENMVSYTGVLKDGKYRIEDYLNAVSYVSHKLMGSTNQDAYAKTFPGRYGGLVAGGATDKVISAYVSAYNKGKLVNAILEQTLVPMWVLNQNTYQNAINTQALLMTSAKSEMVRMQAANSILTHLKRPEKVQVELDVGAVETSGMKQLKDTLTLLAEQQRNLIESGASTKSIAHQKLVTFSDEGGSSQVVDAVVVSSSNGDDTAKKII